MIKKNLLGFSYEYAKNKSQRTKRGTSHKYGKKNIKWELYRKEPEAQFFFTCFVLF